MSSWIFVMNYLVIQIVNPINSSAESDVISKYVPIHEFGYARPITDPERAVTVHMNFELRDVLELTIYCLTSAKSTKSQRIKVRGYIRMKWQNELLNWNATVEGNVYSINLDPSLAWTPEIVAYKSVRQVPATDEASNDDDDDDEDDEREDWTTKTIKTQLKIDSNGTTTWLSPIYLESACHIHLPDFPYDEQVCVMVFGPWVDTVERVKLEDMKLPAVKNGFHNNVEWELKNVTSVAAEVYYKCCKRPISNFIIKIHLKRKSKYYIVQYVLPVVFLILTLLMGNFVPLESSERFNLLLVIFLTAAFMLKFTVKAIFPHTDEISSMSTFYVLLLFDIFLSIMATSIVAVFYFNTSKLLWFPKWLEKRILPKHLWRDEIRKVTEDDKFIDQWTEILESQNAKKVIKGNEEALREVLRLLCKYNNSQYDEAKNERVEMRSRMIAAFLDKIIFCILIIFSFMVLAVITIL